MTPCEHDRDREQLDRATADRLARLRAMRVDVSALRTAVEVQAGILPKRDVDGRGDRWLRLRLPRQIRAAAASLLIAGLVIAGVLMFTSGPVLASPDRMARIHQEMVAGGGRGWRSVDTIEGANAVLASENPGTPAVPDLGGDHVMACCVHMVGRKKMSCVSMKVDGVAVSLAVANAAEVKMPASETVAVDGVPYHVQSAQGVNMVMTERNGRWVCLMGKLPTPHLIEVARGLRY